MRFHRRVSRSVMPALAMTGRKWLWLLVPLIGLASAFGLKGVWHRRVSQVPQRSIAVEDIRVEILNGCGRGGVAQHVGGHLRRLGFEVMTLGNAETFNYPETIVIDRVGKPDYARQVADALGIRNRIQQIIPEPFPVEEVTVVIGRDYRRLGFPAAQ